MKKILYPIISLIAALCLAGCTEMLELESLEKIPEEVEKLEFQIAQLDDQMSQPGFYQSASEEIAAVTRQREDLQNKVDALYARWEELEAKQ